MLEEREKEESKLFELFDFDWISIRGCWGSRGKAAIMFDDELIMLVNNKFLSF